MICHVEAALILACWVRQEQSGVSCRQSLLCGAGGGAEGLFETIAPLDETRDSCTRSGTRVSVVAIYRRPGGCEQAVLYEHTIDRPSYLHKEMPP